MLILCRSQIMRPDRTGLQDTKQTTDQSSNIWTTNGTEQINHLDVVSKLSEKKVANL